nr:DUF2235 domain-containing protein [Bradyrhizobium murdochi]
MRWLYDLASMATGLGITRNIVDGYAAIIGLYEPGDPIYLIGLSRGAYTVRSVAGVMTYCGIPRQLRGGSPLRRDPKSLQKLVEHAVTDVYQFCPSYARKDTKSYRRFLLETRDAIAAEFRRDYGSSQTAGALEEANIFAYFIRVFDTVAALARRTRSLCAAYMRMTPIPASCFVWLVSQSMNLLCASHFSSSATIACASA